MVKTAQLGLAHSYSRAKVKFNVNRADNMIIQSINLLDKLDKDINTFAMRVRYATLSLCAPGFLVCEVGRHVPIASASADLVSFLCREWLASGTRGTSPSWCAW